jgi:hypothetical protein
MTPRRAADAVLVAVFLLGMAAYAAASLSAAVADQRGLTAAAAQTWRPLPARVEDHFNHHLAGRSALVDAHAKLKVDWLGASPNPTVLLGADGWLFLHHNAAAGYLKAGDPAAAGRAAAWAAALSSRRHWLADRGIRFLAVAAPDKQSVYPEFVPGVGRRYGPAPLDDVLAASERDPDLHVLDLRGPLRDAKPSGPVYLKTDTHWNDRGAYAGYAATGRALARWYADLAPAPADICESGPPRSGDLARLVGRYGQMTETPPVLSRRGPRPARVTPEEPAYRREPAVAHVEPRVWSGGDPAGPRVVLLCDSFANDLYCDLLAQHCPRLVRVGAYGPQEDLIDRERPDVVISLFVERMIEGYAPR